MRPRRVAKKVNSKKDRSRAKRVSLPAFFAGDPTYTIKLLE